MGGQGSGGNVLAAIASFFIPGLGQLVQGRLIAVLIFFVLLPLAHLFALTLSIGLLGVWLGATVYVVFAASAMAFKFKRGAWKHIQI